MRLLHFADLHLGVENYRSGQVSCNRLKQLEIDDDEFCKLSVEGNILSKRFLRSIP